VTGLGCVSPVGNSIADAWAALIEGKSGIATITKFDATPFFQISELLERISRISRQL
jgi:3-oxoacyl-(acyl-carrier-protein) synthase